MYNKQIHIYPVPWDITTTCQNGTAKGSNKIKQVIHQVDDIHPFSSNMKNIVFESASNRIIDLQSSYADISRDIINTCNQGKALNQNQKTALHDINKASYEMNQIVYSDCLDLLEKGPMILCGGEHGVGIGYIQALAQKNKNFGILQIDAHMDCRIQYFGYDYSHASVITHYANIPEVSAITQLGIRDYDASEVDFQKKSKKQFHVFKDYDCHKRLFEGDTWKMITTEIVDSLPENVVISLDIDGLSLDLSSASGTPVPGGVTWNQLIYLLECISQHKTLIGAELVEVRTESDNHIWPTLVGAKIMILLANLIEFN